MLCVSMELQAKGCFPSEPWILIHSALHQLPWLPAAIGASFKFSVVCLRGSAMPCSSHRYPRDRFLPTDAKAILCIEGELSQLPHPRFFPGTPGYPHLLQGLLRKPWGSGIRLKASPPPPHVQPSPCHSPPGSGSHRIPPQA